MTVFSSIEVIRNKLWWEVIFNDDILDRGVAAILDFKEVAGGACIEGRGARIESLVGK